MEPSLTSPSQTSPHGPFVDVLEDDWGIRMSNYAQVVSTAPGTYDVGWDFSPSASCTTVVLSFEEGNIVYDEGGAGFDEFWDVLGGTDLSSVAGGIALPALSDVNDGIDRGVTTGTLVQWSGTEWVGVTAVDGGAP
jgi:hypothetical protein